MPAPPGYITFSPSGSFPTLTNVSFPPLGTLVTFANLYGDGSDGYIGPIYWALDAASWLKTNAAIRPTVSTQYTRASNAPPVWASSSAWVVSIATGGWQANTTTTTNVLFFPLNSEALPNGAQLNSVSVYVTGSPTDAGLPATMPKLLVYYAPINGGAPTQLGSTTTDSSATLGAYQAAHALTVSGLTHTVDRSQYVYYAEVAPEGGAGSNAGMMVAWPSATWTATTSPTF